MYVSILDTEAVHNIRLPVCLNYLFEKSGVKYMHISLLPYQVLLCARCLKHTQREHGGVICHGVLTVSRESKAVPSQVQVPELHCCRAVSVGMLRLGSAGAVVLT